MKPAVLYRIVDQGVEERQAGDIHRRLARATRRGFPARLAGSASRSGSGGVTAVAKPDLLIVDGHGFSWQRLCDLRRQQLEAWRAPRERQLALFELKEDCRPAAERTAAGRYAEPTLLELMTIRKQVVPLNAIKNP